MCGCERVEGREELRLPAGHLINASQWLRGCELKGAFACFSPPTLRYYGFLKAIPPPCPSTSILLRPSSTVNNVEPLRPAYHASNAIPASCARLLTQSEPWTSSLFYVASTSSPQARYLSCIHVQTESIAECHCLRFSLCSLSLQFDTVSSTMALERRNALINRAHHLVKLLRRVHLSIM